MRAWAFTNYNGPNALTFTALSDPTPGDDDILIRVHASSVNPWDTELTYGTPWVNRMIVGGLRKPKKINVLGCDVAGEVVKTGANITKFGVGDRVFGDLSGGAWGGYGELTIAKENELARIPDRLSMCEAAALPQAGVLAIQGIEDHLKLSPGMEVLVNGAGGGVGPMAIQLAKSAGAHVTAVDAGEKRADLESLGLKEFIDYQSQDFTQLDRKYDLILDPVQQHSGNAYRRVLTDFGCYVTIGGKYRHILGIFTSTPFQPLRGNKRLRIVIHKAGAENLSRLIDHVNADRIRPFIAKTYAFADLPAALLDNERGTGCGKLVIDLTQ